MGDKMEYPVKSEKTKRAIWELHGMAIIQDALKQKIGVTAPGFALVSAIVDKEVADARTSMATHVIREAARAGVDVGRATLVTSDVKDGKLIIRVEMPDLLDDKP